MVEHSPEFLERRDLQKGDIKVAKLKHKLDMEALEFRRESNRLFHERTLERGRITRAEERKMLFHKRGY